MPRLSISRAPATTTTTVPYSTVRYATLHYIHITTLLTNMMIAIVMIRLNIIAVISMIFNNGIYSSSSAKIGVKHGDVIRL